jgi:hypothetical protein
MSSYWRSIGMLVVYFLPTTIIGLCVFWADTEAPGFKGKISRLFMETLPSKTYDLAVIVVGEKAAMSIADAVDWIVRRRNPLLQILYLLILGGCSVAWIKYGEPLLENGGTYFVKTYPHGWHSKWEAYIGLVICLTTWILANTLGPGRVEKKTLRHMLHTPYDGLMFEPSAFCTTCRLPKPARSKHCSMCGFCVPTFDHHCIWLNQCVGEQNYRWFMLFLIVHASVFLYFGVMLLYLLVSPIYEYKLWDYKTYHPVTREAVPTWQILMQFVIFDSRAIFLLTLVALVFGLGILGFLIFHCYLTFRGLSTNEHYKWMWAKRLHKHVVGCFERYDNLVKKAAQRAAASAAAAPAATSAIAPDTGTPVKDSHKSHKSIASDTDDSNQGMAVPSAESQGKGKGEVEGEVEQSDINVKSQEQQTKTDAETKREKDKDLEPLVYHASADASTTFLRLREFIDCPRTVQFAAEHPGPFPECSPYKEAFFARIKSIVFPPCLYPRDGLGCDACDGSAEGKNVSKSEPQPESQSEPAQERGRESEKPTQKVKAVGVASTGGARDPGSGGSGSSGSGKADSARRKQKSQ